MSELVVRTLKLLAENKGVFVSAVKNIFNTRTMTTIKISDLSVGDWVKCDGKHKQIKCIDWQNNNYFVHFSDPDTDDNDYAHISGIEPIPITPEILEANGFTLCEDCTSRWKKEFSSCCVYVTAPEGYASVTVYKRVAHGYRRVIDDLQLNGVHQLQHALRLAGVDKEINLM